MTIEVPTLSIVVPFFNERQNVEPFFTRLLPILRRIEEPFEIVCLNDGSTDGTLDALLQQQERTSQIVILDLSRNFGKEAALTAGLDHARGAAIIPMDCDLQDPPELIPHMIARWRDGHEVVLCRREDRSSDGVAKRLSAACFYKVHNLVADVPIPENVGDFRLMDRAVVEAIKSLPERQRFMKGLFAWAGFRQTTLDYTREARHAGRTTWNWWRLWNFGIEGVTAFSTVPLRLWTYVGGVISLLSFLYAGFIIVRTLMLGVDVPGYASLMVVILFLGGLQLISLGVLGEYVGRIQNEAKQRPIYVLRRVYECPTPVVSLAVSKKA